MDVTVPLSLATDVLDAAAADGAINSVSQFVEAHQGLLARKFQNVFVGYSVIHKAAPNVAAASA